MITEYLRPKTLDEALALLARENPPSFPLGGGTVLNRGMDIDYAVVDLQALGLGEIVIRGNENHVGATATLQQLRDHDSLPGELYNVIELEATYNLRQMATIAGSLVTANGRSHLATALMALDATIEFQSLNKKTQSTKLGDWLLLRKDRNRFELITEVNFPSHVRFAYDYIARTPADQPIVSAAVTQWNSGRTRLALGGWGEAPVLALDGPSSEGIAEAARNAFSLAGDEWGSAEYRQEMAGILSMRCLQRFISPSDE